jgi:hypothetical protein
MMRAARKCVERRYYRVRSVAAKPAACVEKDPESNRFPERIDVAYQPKKIRDHQIFNAHHAGQSIEQLASEYGLAPTRIRDIIRNEGFRCSESPEPCYCEFRLRNLLRQIFL